MEITSLVISHKKADIRDIEKAWHGDCCEIISRVLSNPNIDECALLFTCNRVEVYVVGKDTVNFLYEFAKEMGVPKRILDIYVGRDCLNHILRVASGLESMIVGEDQILGQVKYFYNICKKCGGIGEILDLVFRKAIHVGTKVRRLTRINKGSVSIASTGVELLDREVGLNGKKVLLIGAGEMGSAVARHLSGKVDLYIANRTFERGLNLAKEVGAKAVRFDEIEKYIDLCDIIITATSATHPIITRDMAKPGKVFLDIALPRNVDEDVCKVEGVRLYTIDDLRRLSEENLRKRLKEIEKAEKIIDEELKLLEESLKALRAKRAIRAMYKRAEAVKREEIIEAFNKLKAKYNIDDSAIQILESFANSLIKKFLSYPTLKLKELAKSNSNLNILPIIESMFVDGGDGFVSDSENEEVKAREIKKTCERG
ncbi:glutamyl-tRNA reductase [Archaeoglobus profundus]|uniref:Glutamyl-tRNA reductase n=1 Tax=Archaeoglobus profundus (strain DSM 5631 / JCM 9629 / NBRC 100127 / Av18) TaxID=572546 RepID=D2RED6_ARCPA|nr:glutamyl-tRNA reductase [Archaeoglobus profundus]ADB58480.1 glutamyl-tRNA reductase [Archaeoglobus profundus DSM 5631]